MQNYNLIHSIDDISNEDALEGSGILKSDFFPVSVSGIPTITITDLIGVTLLGLWREDAPWQQITGTLVDKTYTFDDTTGDFVFFTDLNPNEKIYALWYTGAAPTIFQEPVGLQEMKDYLRQEGFTGSDESLSEFDFDDTLISDMITGARELTEKYNGISVVTHRWEVTLTNCAGLQELPYGPVNAIGSWVDAEGNSLMSEYKLLGRQFPQIKCPLKPEMVIQYVSGYTNVPKALKIAIMKQVCWMYEHRGEETKETFCEDSINLSLAYNRKSWLA